MTFSNSISLMSFVSNSKLFFSFCFSEEGKRNSVKCVRESVICVI